MKRSTRLLYLLAGSLCVLLAVVGMFLPVLPTTPFLLLASFCFARSSERLNQWLINNRWFGTYIRNYREGRGVTLRHKVITILLLWLTIGYAGWVVSFWWLKLLLLAIAIGVTWHLAKMKTFRPGHHDGQADQGSGSSRESGKTTPSEMKLPPAGSVE